VYNFHVSVGGDITYKYKNLKFLDKLQFIREIAAHLGISRDHVPGHFTLRVIGQRVVASVDWITSGLTMTLLIKYEQRKFNVICVVLTNTLIM
jgi:hypothetical protein